jgi:hypothetical protein
LYQDLEQARYLFHKRYFSGGTGILAVAKKNCKLAFFLVEQASCLLLKKSQ